MSVMVKRQGCSRRRVSRVRKGCSNMRRSIPGRRVCPLFAIPIHDDFPNCYLLTPECGVWNPRSSGRKIWRECPNLRFNAASGWIRNQISIRSVIHIHDCANLAFSLGTSFDFKVKTQRNEPTHNRPTPENAMAGKYCNWSFVGPL